MHFEHICNVDTFRQHFNVELTEFAIQKVRTETFDRQIYIY